MSMGAWVLLQVWLGGSWGVGGPAWQSYGTQLRKSSGLNAPRALVQVLNGADSKDFPYQTDNPRAAGWGDSLVSPCLNTENAPKLYVHFAYQRGGLMDPPKVTIPYAYGDFGPMAPGKSCGIPLEQAKRIALS
jgi:hypothetical protein